MFTRCRPAFIAILSLASALAWFAPRTASAQPCNLVTNGGFETGSLSGWTQFGDTSFAGIDTNSPHSGTFEAFFGPFNPGGIQQVIAANVGDVLTVSFWTSTDGLTPNFFSADLDGVNLVTITNDGAHGYTLHTYTHTVTSANPTLSFTFSDVPSYIYLDDVIVTAAGNSACCSVPSGVCLVVTGGAACPAGMTPAPPGSPCCTPNLCPHPTACCDDNTGACAVAAIGVSCPAGSSPAPGGALSCSPFPCIFPGTTCTDCTYVNGAFDNRSGQLSHLGGSSPNGAKAADDFSLCNGYVYDLTSISATLLTTTFPGLVKPIAEVWSDCNGCPGTLLYKFDTATVVELGTDLGPAFDGRPLRLIHATWNPTNQLIVNNRNVVLKGGQYWLSIYGQSDGLGPSMQMYDVTYWGTTDGIKGKPAEKIDGTPSGTYNVFTFPTGCGPTAWHSIADDCCLGCTDLNFSVCTNPCKIIVDNGAGRHQVAAEPVGSTSKFAPTSGSAIETRSADDFVLPPCEDWDLCYVEACIFTNCPVFDGVFELYSNNCNKPDYALHGSPLFGRQFLATKIVPLNYQAFMDGQTVSAYRLEFHDLGVTLAGGQQYWISAGVRHTFSINERAYFCYNVYCDNRCPIKWNEGRVLTATSLDSEAAAHGCISPAPITGCNGWSKLGNDFSFLIAASGFEGKGGKGNGAGASGSGSGTTGCPADVNRDGTLNVQDVFDFLNTWFTGCP